VPLECTDDKEYLRRTGPDAFGDEKITLGLEPDRTLINIQTAIPAPPGVCKQNLIYSHVAIKPSPSHLIKV